MRITGRRAKSGLGVVSIYLIAKDSIRGSIRFYADTGASHTCISPRDARRLGINYNHLDKAPYQVGGVGGMVDAYLLREPRFLFIFEDSIHIEFLNSCLVLKAVPKKGESEKERHAAAQKLPSLLGVDVLENYSVKLTPKSVILEK